MGSISLGLLRFTRRQKNGRIIDNISIGLKIEGLLRDKKSGNVKKKTFEFVSFTFKVSKTSVYQLLVHCNEMIDVTSRVMRFKVQMELYTAPKYQITQDFLLCPPQLQPCNPRRCYKIFFLRLVVGCRNLILRKYLHIFLVNQSIYKQLRYSNARRLVT